MVSKNLQLDFLFVFIMWAVVCVKENNSWIQHSQPSVLNSTAKFRNWFKRLAMWWLFQTWWIPPKAHPFGPEKMSVGYNCKQRCLRNSWNYSKLTILSHFCIQSFSKISLKARPALHCSSWTIARSFLTSDTIALHLLHSQQ